ncbi:MAG: DedA family protein [Thermoplasmatota archaeon]
MALADILAILTQWALSTVQQFGYPGLFVALLLESTAVPVPSESVLPVAGYLAQQGTFNLGIAWLAATLGSLTGSLISYWIGYAGLLPLVLRYGRYLLIKEEHVAKTTAFFHAYASEVAVGISRFIPVVRHLISLPAGAARMPLGRFVLATLVGAGIWDFILLYTGYLLGKNYTAIEPFFTLIRNVTIVILVALAAVGGAFWFTRRRKRNAKAPA